MRCKWYAQCFLQSRTLVKHTYRIMSDGSIKYLAHIRPHGLLTRSPFGLEEYLLIILTAYTCLAFCISVS